MTDAKLLHVVGGGYDQLPLVETAHTLGLKVLVTDRRESPPCKSAADFYERVDTTDKHATLKVAQNYRISAIVTDQTDAAVPTTAYVAENMGLRGIGYETALRFTNKLLMREALKKTLPTYIPEYHFFNAIEDATAFVQRRPDVENYVVKPINSQGSRGVARLTDSESFETISAAFLEAKNRGVLIEKFVKGNEYSVEAYTEGGRTYNLAVTKKYHYDSNGCIDARNTWLGDISSELEQLLFEANARIIEALELPFGITHAEFKVQDGKPYLIEIAARGGGGSISNKVIPYLTGFVPAQALFCRLLDMPHSIAPEDYKRRFAVLKFFNFAPGKVRRIHVNKSAIEDLMEFHLDIKEGGEIRAIKDSRDRPGYFILQGTDRLRVIERERWVEESIVVEYE